MQLPTPDQLSIVDTYILNIFFHWLLQLPFAILLRIIFRKRVIHSSGFNNGFLNTLFPYVAYKLMFYRKVVSPAPSFNIIRKAYHSIKDMDKKSAEEYKRKMEYHHGEGILD